MWKKVTNKEQLEHLQTGDALIKYPLKGAVQESFDDADRDNLSPRVVSANYGNSLQLGFLFSDKQNDPILGMYKSVFGPIEITYDEIIAKQVWWVFQD